MTAAKKPRLTGDTWNHADQRDRKIVAEWGWYVDKLDDGNYLVFGVATGNLSSASLKACLALADIANRIGREERKNARK